MNNCVFTPQKIDPGYGPADLHLHWELCIYFFFMDGESREFIMTYRNFKGFAIGQVGNCQAFIRSSSDFFRTNKLLRHVFRTNKLTKTCLSNLFLLKKSELLLMKAWQFPTCPMANPLKFLYVVMNSRRKSLSQKKKKKKRKKKKSKYSVIHL